MATVFLFLTEQCNLACQHCYVSASPALTNHMSEQVFERALSVFRHSLGVLDFRLTGGEPTVHPHFRDIVAVLHAHQCRVRLITNGKRLYGNPDMTKLLKSLDSCWVSAYGTTPQQHMTIGGSQALPLETLETWVGELTRRGHAIGVSILLNPGDAAHVLSALDRLQAAGVRRVRLLPAQPDGRGASLYDWRLWPAEIQDIFALLRQSSAPAQFDVLQFNDAFDLAAQYANGSQSCLLHHRTMWSLVPDGDLYSCCFNAYDDRHRVGHIMDPRIMERLATWRVTDLRVPCRALVPDFWAGGTQLETSCPISHIQFAADRGRLSGSDSGS